MSAQILDGIALARTVISQLQIQVRQYVAAGLRSPALAVILVGDDPASRIYVDRKKRQCEAVGIVSSSYHLPATVAEAELLDLIHTINADNEIDGILVQLPLPAHIETRRVIELIDPAKDVDGFHPYNMGCLALQIPALRPCTPQGVMALLQQTGITLLGKDAVIVGASNIVGRPQALELLLAQATVTVCHRHTRQLNEKVRHADIVIACAGVPGLVLGEWIKPGAIVIDVGINRLADASICGDVVFETARARSSWITPVPGGVGPMTVAMLMRNTIEAYRKGLVNAVSSD